MKTVFALAALAAIGFAGTAFAGDASRADSAATAPAAMSDSDMDKITAGDPGKANGNAWGGGTGSGLLNGHSNDSAAAAFTVGKGQGAAHSALHGPQ